MGDDTVIGAWNVRVRKTAQRLVARRRDLFPLTARTFFVTRAATGRAAQGKRYRAGQQASSRYFHSVDLLVRHGRTASYVEQGGRHGRTASYANEHYQRPHDNGRNLASLDCTTSGRQEEA
ncbi:hypothetical protein [Parenemella sanctibonifatiensis]|uniref:hypothetical protein n=1 Tax=Parenemella sanctibonifatiensis TaxID=2016505 RepID=UPI0011854EA1|nr:hypothetical protein [Parenemella sanctibonifatiensis]